ncbi:uncharacterized protein LOC128931414 [Callithrix jacchus]
MWTTVIDILLESDLSKLAAKSKKIEENSNIGLQQDKTHSLGIVNKCSKGTQSFLSSPATSHAWLTGWPGGRPALREPNPARKRPPGGCASSPAARARPRSPRLRGRPGPGPMEGSLQGARGTPRPPRRGPGRKRTPAQPEERARSAPRRHRRLRPPKDALPLKRGPAAFPRVPGVRGPGRDEAPVSSRPVGAGMGASEAGSAGWGRRRAWSPGPSKPQPPTAPPLLAPPRDSPQRPPPPAGRSASAGADAHLAESCKAI